MKDHKSYTDASTSSDNSLYGSFYSGWQDVPGKDCVR